MNDSGIQHALDEFASPDPAQRVAALRQVRDYLRQPRDDERITAALIPLLRDPDANVRRLTAQALGRSADRQAVEPLLETLLDSSAAVRSAVIDALGSLGDRAAVPDLLSALFDESVYVRFAAANALGQIGDPRAVIDLIHMLDNDDIPVAMIAAQSLYKIGTPEALAAIQHLRMGDEYDFSVPPHLDLTLPHIPHIPLPAKQAEADEAAEESFRGIPSDLLNSLSEADSPRAEAGAPRSSAPAPAPPSAAPKPAPAAASPEAPAADPVQFSAYYPPEAVGDVWYPLRAYVFRASAADAVSADAARELGGLLSAFREVVRTALGSVTTGALITATPDLPGFQFNPPSAQIGFYEDWHRFDFKLRAAGATADQASNGRITFAVEGVIVADVPLSIFVGSAAGDAHSAAPVSATSPIYQAIFCSYSHQDTQIVERVERAYKALGLDFLRDVVMLKSGQDWNAELLRMIDRADIFQLFWSNTAAASKYVREEWEHALNLSRPQGFIRPVYWQQPMPPPPPELAAIHFAYEPDLDD